MAGNSKGGGIKQLLLAHVEKVVMVLIVLVAGNLAYNATSIETLTKTKDQLVTQVNNTKQAFDSATWDDSPAEEKLLAHDVASNDIELLPEGSYEPPVDLARPVVPPTVDRVDPALIAPAELEGTAITGILAFESAEEARKRMLEEKLREEKRQQERQNAAGQEGEAGGRGGYGDPNQENDKDEFGRPRRPIAGRAQQEGVPTTGNERFETLSVACVLAKAPIGQQYKQYQAALKDARGYDPGSDVPDYVGVKVERAEVTDSDEPLEWVPVQFGALNTPKKWPVLARLPLEKMIADWIPWPEPLVAKENEHPILTMPLPPLVQQSWGPEVVHSDIMLQSESEAAKLRQNDSEKPAETSEEGEVDIYGRGGGGMARGGREGRGGRRDPGGYGRGGGYGEGGYGGGYGEGAYAGEGGYGGAGAYAGESGYGGRGGGGGARRAIGEYSFDPDVENVLVRVWDFDVVPGRRYRYRMKLLLEDVNRNPRRFPNNTSLAPEVVQRLSEAKGPRETEWSDPGPVISIPMAGDTFVAGARRISDGVDLMVQAFEIDANRRAMKASIQKTFERGAVMNLVEDSEVVSPDGRYIVEIDSFPFRTDLTLIDYRGGNELPGRKQAPVKVLLMDAGGRLYVRDELDDEPIVEAREEIFEEGADGNNFRGGGGYGGGYGEGGY